MRIGVAIEYFDAPNGAATYAHTLTSHLQRIGHEAALLTNHPGVMAELAQEAGVLVVDDVGEPPDVVIAQDPMIAVELADRWRLTPQIYTAHGVETDQGIPPLLDGVTSAAIVMNDRVADQLSGLGIPVRVVRLRQPVDTQRFHRRAPIAMPPRRLLLLGNYLRGPRLQAIDQVVRDAGLDLVRVGEPAQYAPAPEDAIAAADIVMGYGRSILEGMACGRAAYILDEKAGDGWVTLECYEALEADGFAGTAFDATCSAHTLAEDLARYSPQMGEVNRVLILRHHTAHKHAAAVARLCAEVAADTPRRPRSLPADAARLHRAHWHAEWRMRQAVAQLAAADTRARELEERVGQLERELTEAGTQLAELQRTRRYRVAQAMARPLDRLRLALRRRRRR